MLSYDFQRKSSDPKDVDDILEVCNLFFILMCTVYAYCTVKKYAY